MESQDGFLTNNISVIKSPCNKIALRVPFCYQSNKQHWCIYSLPKSCLKLPHNENMFGIRGEVNIFARPSIIRLPVLTPSPSLHRNVGYNSVRLNRLLLQSWAMGGHGVGLRQGSNLSRVSKLKDFPSSGFCSKFQDGKNSNPTSP